jgi:hypothetical protein
MLNSKGVASVSPARFAIDDIKVFYLQAALAHDGWPPSYQLDDCFWSHTRAEKMILDFQQAARLSEDKNLRLIADSTVSPERAYEYLQ